jgi:hypothetical protein
MHASGKLRSGVSGPSEVSCLNARMMDRQIQDYAENPLLLSIERGMAFYSYTIGRPVSVPPPSIDRGIVLSQRVLKAVEDGDVEGASAATRERFNFLSFAFTGRVPGHDPAEAGMETSSR